jgi:oxaloacetate decarboxylase alpha subunit
MALSAFSMGYSFPPTETLVATLAESRLDTGLSLTKLEAIAGKARALRLKYAAKDTASPGLDVRLLKHHLPPYTLRDLEESLENEQASELFEAALAHINTVRLAAGEPVMTEAVSQVLVKQTVLNVLCDSPFQSLIYDYQQLLKNNLRLSEKNNSDLVERVAESFIINNQPLKSLKDYSKALTAWSSADVSAKAGDSKSMLMDYVFYPQATLKLLQQQDVSDTLAVAPKDTEVQKGDTEVYTVSVDGKAYVVSVDSNGQVNGIVPPAQN